MIFKSFMCEYIILFICFLILFVFIEYFCCIFCLLKNGISKREGELGGWGNINLKYIEWKEIWVVIGKIIF